MNTDTSTQPDIKTSTPDDILAKVRAGIEHVEETGESFDIEMTEEEYILYKNSLTKQTPPQTQPVATQTDTKQEIEQKEEVVPSPHKPSVLVQTNETTYEILVREFDLVNKIPRLGARYNALENILSALKVSPALYGITSSDVTKPNVGDLLNIEKISALLHDMTIADKNIIDHANALPDIVISGIEEYMPKDAKEALQKVISKPATPKQNTTKTNTPITILHDPTGIHSLESGLENVMITSGTNEPKENHNETTPMTSEESERVIEALVAEAKLHNIPWKNILLVGSEHVIPFSEKEHSDPLTQRIANLIKIHHVKTEVPMKEQETVLQYLQTTVLDMQRKTA